MITIPFGETVFSKIMETNMTLTKTNCQVPSCSPAFAAKDIVQQKLVSFSVLLIHHAVDYEID